MSKTKAPELTPSPSSTKKSNAGASKTDPSKVFISMVLDMSWRLALVFLIPIVLGAELDRRYHVGPTYLIIGFMFGVLGACLVVYRMYKLANKITKQELKVGRHAS